MTQTCRCPEPVVSYSRVLDLGSYREDTVHCESCGGTIEPKGQIVRFVR